MSRRVILTTASGIVMGGVLFNAVPALADLPTIDVTTDGILATVQTAVTDAISTMQKGVTDALTDLGNPESVSSLLTLPS